MRFVQFVSRLAVKTEDYRVKSLVKGCITCGETNYETLLGVRVMLHVELRILGMSRTD
jgi:hypothetical protein